MANYDNSQYTYAQVYGGTGYFQKDDLNRYSAGVLEVQQKMNYVGFWCGEPDGKFGSNTEIAIRQFQREYVGTVNGKVAQSTLVQLELKYATSNGFTQTGQYSIFFDFQSKKFMYSQQVFYEALKNAGYNNYAIAGFMGNFQLESGFNPRWAGSDGSVGVAQWLGDRKTNLNNYVNSSYGDRENANEQSAFMLIELTSTNSSYYRSSSTQLNIALNNTAVVTDEVVAADYVAALYEGCRHYATWNEVLSSGISSRFIQSPNAFDDQFYIDIAQRRGYAESYYGCLEQIP